MIEAYNEKTKIEQQRQATEIYVLADLIAASVGRLLDKEATYPEIHQVFPTLFDAPVQQERENQQWLLMKERMIDFAENRKKLTSMKEGE